MAKIRMKKSADKKTMRKAFGELIISKAAERKKKQQSKPIFSISFFSKTVFDLAAAAQNYRTQRT